MSVFLTRLQVSLYIRVPQLLFYELQLVSGNTEQENLDTPRDELEYWVEQVDREEFPDVEVLEGILENASNLGVNACVVYTER